jgi:hypothetical protein
MTRVKSILFYTMAMAILCYSAWELGLVKVSASTATAARTCCTYQVDCAEDQTCTWIHPYCSEANHYICKANKAEEIEPVEGGPVEVVR